jgi:hypothetical protein
MMADTGRRLMTYLLPLVLATAAVVIGDQVGRFMGLRGWWRVGLAVLEAGIGVLTAVKLRCLT